MSEEQHDDRLDTVLRTLGDRVRAMRLARGMSITSLSFEAELAEELIRSVEAGRTSIPMEALVALSDVFEVGVADLFGDATAPAAPSDAIDAPSSSPHVVPSPVIWGGDLPPAPWVSPEAAPPAPPAAAPPPPAAAPRASPHRDAESPASRPRSADLPPAPWVTAPTAPSTAPAPEHVAVPPTAPPPTEALAVPSVAPHVHQRAAQRGMREASAYVFVAPGAPGGSVPRTFADLRTGPLAGRSFRSLREFAVASVVEGHHAVADVARVFRVPVWRLEQWVREGGSPV